jgi:hypothetical protein
MDDADGVRIRLVERNYSDDVSASAARRGS